MLGNFPCFCCTLLTFFKVNFLKIRVSKALDLIRVSNTLDPDQERHLGPNGLQRLSADDNSCKERVNDFPAK